MPPPPKNLGSFKQLLSHEALPSFGGAGGGLPAHAQSTPHLLRHAAADGKADGAVLVELLTDNAEREVFTTRITSFIMR